MNRFLNKLLWLAFIVAMASSVTHVAWAFGSLEFEGSEGLGWLAAIAVDAGLASMAYSIQQRRRVGRPAWSLWVGVVLFSAISGFANLLHALTATTGKVTSATFSTVDPLAMLQAVVLSASLPFLVLYLGEVVSSDDASASDEADAERDRLAALAETERLAALAQREQERLLAQEKRLEAEALANAERLKLEAEQAKAERERLKAEREALKAAEVAANVCHCGRSFPTVNALRAHQRVHKNGKVASDERQSSDLEQSIH